MTNRLRLVGLLLLIGGCGHAPEAREIHVAAAANLQTVLGEIARDFKAKTGIGVVPTMGATAQLTQQIENGAPVDVFLAADTQHVDQLISNGFGDPQSRAVYARGRLVLWAPQHTEIASLADLASPQVKRVGCARPELAPYGLAAVQALRKAGLWDVVEPKLVYGQSITAAKQFADSGNAEASFTALSLVYNRHYVLVDEKLYDPIEQALCIVKQSAQQEAAGRFRAFVLGDEGQAILGKYGYAKPSRP